MNILLLVGFGAAAIAVIWIAQSCLLLLRGEPLVGPLRLRHAPPAVRWPMKIVLQLVLLGILFGYPLALGQEPLGYHRARLVPARPDQLLEMWLVVPLFFTLGLAAEVVAGWVQVKRRYGAWKTLRKAAQSLLTPLPLAFVEEGIFRGVVLDQMLRGLPAGAAGAVLGVILSAAVFSGAHFIRRARAYWPALGLFLFGCLVGMAYLVGGRTYWLPVGIHAGGILATQLHRPFVEYRGPIWIIGNRDHPLAGAIGICVMILVALYMVGRWSGMAVP